MSRTAKKSKRNAPLKTIDAKKLFTEFVAAFKPVETELGSKILIMVDHRTNATYCECHIKGSALIKLGTVDVPLDPDEQLEYRANRELVTNSGAFQRMKEDANHGRTFSNIVAEYTHDFDPEHPLKIIGGQHRFMAIKDALEAGIDEYHGVKVYLALNTDQRFDVQVISNTNIAISKDLYDRMQETARGPQLRDWCQDVGLLPTGKDFADERERGGPIPVQYARTFITNYFKGKEIDAKSFALKDTTPILCRPGEIDLDWDSLIKRHGKELWNDQKLNEAAKEFVLLINAQRAAFSGKKPKPKPDYPQKALSPAILAAWAYVAGILYDNEPRLRRHYALRETKGIDPLNAAALVNGKHKTDADNYRGLGYRTDPRERGRFVELFFLQAEDGRGITNSSIDLAIKKFHAKRAQLDVIKAEEH